MRRMFMFFVLCLDDEALLSHCRTRKQNDLVPIRYEWPSLTRTSLAGAGTSKS